MAPMVMGPAQVLLEIEQIKQLKARYFRFLDGKRWAEWRTCFTDDMRHYMGNDSVPRSTSGDEFVAAIVKHLADTITVHQGHMPEIELTSHRTARGVWAMFDWVDRRNDPENSHQGYGHYVEDYEKGTDGKWRINSLRLIRIRDDKMPVKR